MATAVGLYPSGGSATSLTVYNIPFSADEGALHMLFPSASDVHIYRNQALPANSPTTGVLHFNTPNDCHKAYADCQDGKELGGQTLYAELGAGQYSNQSQRQQSYPRERNENGSAGRSYGGRSQEDSSYRHGSDNRDQDGTIMTVSNLPYSASERDIRSEFPGVQDVTINLDGRGRSSGVAQLTFRTRDQCEAALQACNNKSIQGRQLRGRMGQGQARQESGPQRNYDNRQSYQSNYNSNRRDFDSGRRSRGGGDWRESRGGRDGGDWRDSRGSRDGGRDFRRGGGGGSDRGGSRRERSPNQGEPVRGYAASKGFRITSAVIQGNVSPMSSSSSDEN